MRNYLDLMRGVLDRGSPRDDRTGVGTTATFGEQLSFDLRDGFPLLTTKRMAFGQIAAELACFLRGNEFLSQFHTAGCHIWDANATAPYWIDKGRTQDEDVWLGRIYGVQWRRWLKGKENGKAQVVDQLAEAVRLIQEDPHSRRICVTAWNPGELDQMCLPPCHLYYQFFAAGEFLDCLVVMRSVDVFIGMPFDIASYALLLSIVAQQTGKEPRCLRMTFGDTHVYRNHADLAKLQLKRDPLPLPRLALHPDATINSFEPWMVRLIDYHSWAAIKGDMNV